MNRPARPPGRPPRSPDAHAASFELYRGGETRPPERNVQPAPAGGRLGAELLMVLPEVEDTGPRCARAGGRPPARDGPGRQVVALLAVFVVVIGTDQSGKWFAWQHVDGALVNDGGYVLLNPVVRSWLAAPVSGTAANVVGAFSVLAAVGWLTRRPRGFAALIGGGLLAAGWTSNLLDRFGLHRWSAPGSSRGVVDFIPSGGVSRCNLADLWMVLGVVVVGSAIARHRRLMHAAPGRA